MWTIQFVKYVCYVFALLSSRAIISTDWNWLYSTLHCLSCKCESTTIHDTCCRLSKCESTAVHGTCHRVRKWRPTNIHGMCHRESKCESTIMHNTWCCRICKYEIAFMDSLESPTTKSLGLLYWQTLWSSLRSGLISKTRHVSPTFFLTSHFQSSRRLPFDASRHQITCWIISQGQDLPLWLITSITYKM